MKVGILADDSGFQCAAEPETAPQAMVEIGGKPLVWHIMKHAACYGFKEFVIALGYKGEYLKRYMMRYHLLQADLTVDLQHGNITMHEGAREDWTVDLIDTYSTALSGCHIKRLASSLGHAPFLLTRGNGVSNIDLHKLCDFHRSHGRLATIMAVRPPLRFDTLECRGGRVVHLCETSQGEAGWINGGVFVLEPSVFDYISDHDTQWEGKLLQRLATDGQLMVYHHDAFWQRLDTVQDTKQLNDLWEAGRAPWRIWK